MQKRILGVDLGDARTGLAVSDALGFLAGGIGYIKSGHMPKIAEEVLAAAKEHDVEKIVIGNPINTASGTTIIPISKISMGIATGGLDYNGKNAGNRQNFGGGGGTGLSIAPVGFLTIKADGSVEMVNINPAPAGTIEQVADVIERTPEIFAKLKEMFGKKKKKTDDVTETETTEGDTIEVVIE